MEFLITWDCKLKHEHKLGAAHRQRGLHFLVMKRLKQGAQNVSSFMIFDVANLSLSLSTRLHDQVSRLSKHHHTSR